MNDSFLNFLGMTKKAGKLLEGYNKCEDAIKRRKVSLVVLSKDISENSKEKFVKYCDTYNVSLVQSYSKWQLGSALGKEEINVLGITDANMSNHLKVLLVQNNKKNTGV